MGYQCLILCIIWTLSTDLQEDPTSISYIWAKCIPKQTFTWTWKRIQCFRHTCTQLSFIPGTLWPWKYHLVWPGSPWVLLSVCSLGNPWTLKGKILRFPSLQCLDIELPIGPGVFLISSPPKKRISKKILNMQWLPSFPLKWIWLVKKFYSSMQILVAFFSLSLNAIGILLDYWVKSV